MPILQAEFPNALAELNDVLSQYRIGVSEVIGGGGGETSHTQRLRRALDERGWKKKNIQTMQSVLVSDTSGRRAAEAAAKYELPSESHEVDHVKRFESGTIALELEWNNKDPFYDRDLENFRRLHHIGLVSVGVIITRGPTLQDHLRSIFSEHYSDTSTYTSVEDLPGTVGQKEQIMSLMSRGHSLGDAAGHVFFTNKFGTATTHWAKLMERVDNRLLGHPCPLLLVGIEATRIDPLS
ncbi:BglII/BstYI family type II restriction endonuclease [Lentisalinibacter salinarum]|uniref:BglII/BstYI family type II restriction endonuclease n=1 Tax=Lentisalinibacter salinarum TaxID=2992239 RepID=UPI00386D18AF